MNPLISVNPANEEMIEKYIQHTDAEIEDKLSLADRTQKDLENLSVQSRKEMLLSLAKTLRNKKEELSKRITLEMGKPILQSYAEVEKCAWVCEYYAENVEQFLQDKIINTDASKSFVAYKPLGVVLAVMPWNFPYWQVFRFSAPALAAGNGAILKHASNVSGCALDIENIYNEAGIPNGAFQTLLIESSRVNKIIENNIVKAVTLTGSTPAGKAVASKAGSCLKKTVLELGGSDPYVILDDADLFDAVKSCVNSRLINGGQSCIAAKRFIVTEKNYDEFLQMFLDEMKSKKMGDPLDTSNDIGPQARNELRNELHQQVELAVKQGAEALLGGIIPDMKGAYYPPTVLIKVEEDNIAFKEELFGPVAPIIKAKNENHAIDLANNTTFGLGAAVFTKDVEKGEYIAKNKFNAGSCFINTFVKSDPRLPFGGIKESGYGRELSLHGFYEFLNIKTVYVK